MDVKSVKMGAVPIYCQRVNEDPAPKKFSENGRCPRLFLKLLKPG